jgi:Cytidylate kinase-like family
MQQCVELVCSSKENHLTDGTAQGVRQRKHFEDYGACRSARGQNRKRGPRGKGIAAFSQERPRHAAGVFYAPRENKVRRLVARGKSENEVQQFVDTVDHERGDFIQKYFHVEWPDRTAYHAMINTAIGDQTVVHMILDFMQSLNETVTAGVPGK